MRKNHIAVVSTLAFLFTVVLLAACSGYSSNKTPLTGTALRFDSQDFLVTQGNIQEIAGSITGDGTLYAVMPLSKQQVNFSVPMNLAQGQSVTLVAFTNKNLTNGVEIELSVNKENAVQFQVRNGDGSIELKNEPVGSLKAGGFLGLSVDLHADHGHGGIYLNDELVGKEFHFSKAVGGSYWGLKIQGAQVSGAAVRDALEQD